MGVAELSRWSMIQGMRALPKGLLSRCAGLFAKTPLGPLTEAELRAFGRLAGVNFDEVRDPLSSFRCLQDFFIRELKEGARPIDSAPDAFVSPCDGAWGQAGPIEGDTLLQVKGRPYTLAELLDDDKEAERFVDGTFATLYLSPRDYHRFHAPCDGKVTHARYVPGTLWPVNQAGILYVDRLFVKNERVVTYVEVPGGTLALIPVGATMVGCIRIDFDSELTSNQGERCPIVRSYDDVTLRKGEEWGRFEFGSTIVVVATPGLLALDVQPPGTPVVLGRRIGTCLQAGQP